MKRLFVLAAIASGALPSAASALCYTVYGANSVVIWRGTDTPIDLSKPIHEGMRRVFPAGSFLRIEEETRTCTPIGPQDFFGPIPGLTGPVPGVPGMQGGMTAVQGESAVAPDDVGGYARRGVVVAPDEVGATTRRGVVVAPDAVGARGAIERRTAAERGVARPAAVVETPGAVVVEPRRVR